MSGRNYIIVVLLLILSPLVSAQADQIKVTLLQINDVYEILPARADDLGGLDRVANLRNDLVKDRGVGHVYTVLAGDCVSPSVMGHARLVVGDTLTDERMAGRQMIAVLNSMELKYATFGNHEFDIKAGEFKARLEESKFSWFSSNAVVDPRAWGTSIPQSVVIEIPGSSKKCSIKVGMLGLTLDFKTDPKTPNYAHFENFLRSAQVQVDQLRLQGCQVIVAITHLSIEQDRILSKLVPGIHLIIGGHEHQHNYESQPPSSLLPPIAKADANARTAYIHDFVYDTELGKLTVESRLKFIDNAVGSDPKTLATMKDWTNKAFAGLVFEGEKDPARGTKFKVIQLLKSRHKLPENITNDDLQKTIIKVGVDLDGRETTVRTGRTNLTKFVVDTMRLKSKKPVDLAILNSGSIRIDDVISKAGISVYDIFRILPYEVMVYRVDMKGSLLRRLLEAGRSKDVFEEGAFLQASNFDFDKKLIEDTNKPIDDNEIYTVAISEFVVAGKEKALEAVLPKRDIGALSKLDAKLNEIHLDDMTPPFDLLEAVGERFVEFDQTGKSDAEITASNHVIEAMKPDTNPLDISKKAAAEKPETASFSVNKIACEEPKHTPSPTPVEAPLDWWYVLAIYSCSGFLGGILATLRSIKLNEQAIENRWVLPANTPALLSTLWNWFNPQKKWAHLILYNAAGGVGGAFAALFFMILDGKIKLSPLELEKLTYASTGFIAGFLGLPLLNLAASGILNTARIAADSLLKREVAGVKQEVVDVKQELEQKVENVLKKLEQKVDSIYQNLVDEIKKEKDRSP